jgi:hypothetical protein
MPASFGALAVHGCPKVGPVVTLLRHVSLRLQPISGYAAAMEKTFFEEMKVKGRDLVDKVKAIVHEGNARRIILKDEKGQTFLEIPLSIAAVGVVAVPLLAGLGAIAALVANFTLVVERVKEDPPAA